MLIANGKKIDVYLLDTRKTLLDRIASSFNILPEYILDTNFPYILEHDIHHKYFNYNYGSMFIFMDKLCGTYKTIN